MAVEEGCGSLAQPAALRLGKLVQQRPMLLNSHRTRCPGLRRGLKMLHTIHIAFLPGIVNSSDLRFHARSRGRSLAWVSFKSVIVRRK
jgi:hypothetical protein